MSRPDVTDVPQVQQCPQEGDHLGHRYKKAPGIAGEWWCPGIEDRRSGDDRREDAAYNHPQHYGGEDNPYETIKVLESWMGDDVVFFSLGNAIKYLSRAGKKDPTKTIEDLRKAIWYINHVIEFMERDSAT